MSIAGPGVELTRHGSVRVGNGPNGTPSGVLELEPAIFEGSTLNAGNIISNVTIHLRSLGAFGLGQTN